MRAVYIYTSINSGPPYIRYYIYVYATNQTLVIKLPPRPETINFLVSVLLYTGYTYWGSMCSFFYYPFFCNVVVYRICIININDARRCFIKQNKIKKRWQGKKDAPVLHVWWYWNCGYSMEGKLSSYPMNENFFIFFSVHMSLMRVRYRLEVGCTALS